MAVTVVNVVTIMGDSHSSERDDCDRGQSLEYL